MATYTSADIGCPYYLRDDPKTYRLTCEGLFHNSMSKSWFRNKRDMMDHIGRYCAGNWKLCPWYQLLSGVKYK